MNLSTEFWDVLGEILLFAAFIAAIVTLIIRSFINWERDKRVRAMIYLTLGVLTLCVGIAYATTEGVG